MNLSLVTQEDLSQLRQAYKERLKIDRGSCSSLNDLMSDLLSNPGSLIRGQLCLSSMLNRGGDREKAISLATGLEYFHLASLLFDDLPCMDNASERRGRPCVHKKYGEAETILAALAFVNRAYALLWDVIGELPNEQRKVCANLVERCLGLRGVLCGQSMDISYNAAKASSKSVTAIADRKTGSFFLLSLVLPAFVIGVDKREIRYLERLSFLFGRAYQLLDDQKDLHLSEQETGKSARDIDLNRPNMFLKMGVGYSEQYFQRLLSLIEKNIYCLEKFSSGLSIYKILFKYLESTTEKIQINVKANAVN